MTMVLVKLKLVAWRRRVVLSVAANGTTASPPIQVDPFHAKSPQRRE
jgi:hypothetical protein